MNRLSRVHPLMCGVAVASIAACGGDPAMSGEKVTVELAGVVGDQDFACGTAYELGDPASEVEIADFRFYVHDVRLVRADGSEEAIELDRNDYQYDGVALIDFETGSDGCEGNSGENTVVEGRVAKGEYVGLVFRLGVPFERNHSRTGKTPSPLNLNEMAWAWKDGYKFIRIDGVGTSYPGLRFHLGSVACKTDAAGRTTGCDIENRSEIRLDAFDPRTEVVAFDLAELFAGVDLSMNAEDTPIGCMSSPDDADCEPFYEAVGLDADGQPTDSQTVFRAR